MQKLPTLDWRKTVTKPSADPAIDKYNKRMQGLLAATGDYNGKIDGIHGPLSQKGLSALQVRTNSGDGRGNADLLAGENTWAAALGLR